MSGTVRILAVILGVALWATLSFGTGARWYLAIPAGLAIFMIFPICDRLVAEWRGNRRLDHIVKDAQDRRDGS